MFTSQIPLLALAGLCRNLRHMLESGLTLSKAMRMQAKKGPPSVRDVAGRLAARMEKGEDLQTCLLDEADHFPPIFLSLGSVAEETGRLPEILQQMEEYFEMQVQLKRDFISQITMPALQFAFIALLFIPFVIYMLGFLESVAGKNPFSVLGLKGETGVMIWYGGVTAFVILLVAGYWAARNVMHLGPTVDRILLSIPALGGALMSLALTRFCLALNMTMESGMPTAEALRLSLKATSNYAFIGCTDRIVLHIKEGQELTTAMRETFLFPEEFLLVLENAELTGQVPEVMFKQAKIHHENAVRRLKILASVAAKCCYAFYAIFAIILILNLGMQYVNLIDNAASGKF